MRGSNEKTQLVGRIIALSPSLTFKNLGEAILLKLNLKEEQAHFGRENDECFLTLRCASEHFKKIRIGKYLKFINVRRFTEFLGTWYLAEKFEEILENVAVDNISVCEQLICVDQMSLLHKNMLLPRTVTEKCSLESSLFSIRGCLHKYHRSGALEFRCKDHGKIWVFLTYHQASEIGNDLVSGALTKVNSVMPVYLWAKLAGFSTTVRSKIDVDPSTKSNQVETIKPLSIPPDVASSCAMFAAWKVNLLMKITEILGAPSSGEDSGGGQRPRSKIVDDVVTTIGAPSGLEELVCVGPSRSSLLQQFSDPVHWHFMLVRAGHDSDWLSAQFPKVHTTRNVLERARAMAAQLRSRFGAMQQSVWLSGMQTGAFGDTMTATATAMGVVAGAGSGGGGTGPWMAPSFDGHIADEVMGMIEDIACHKGGVGHPWLTARTGQGGADSSVVVALRLSSCSRNYKVLVLITLEGSLVENDIDECEEGGDGVAVSRCPPHSLATTPAPCPQGRGGEGGGRGTFKRTGGCDDEGKSAQEEEVAPALVLIRNGALFVEQDPCERGKMRVLVLVAHRSQCRVVRLGDADTSEAGGRSEGIPADDSSFVKYIRSFLQRRHIFTMNTTTTCVSNSNSSISSAQREMPCYSHQSFDSMRQVARVLAMTSAGSNVRSQREPIGGDRITGVGDQVALGDLAGGAGAGVRDVLLTPLVATGPSGRRLRSLTGVVIHKSVDFGCARSEGGAGGGARQQKKCRLVLRDVSCLDTITVYLSLEDAVPCFVGLVVCVEHATLKGTQNNRHVYVIGSPATKVGIAGMVTVGEVLGLVSLTAQVVLKPCDVARACPDLPPVPRTTLAQLHVARGSNRCLWRVVGHALFVRSLGARLQCPTCRVPATRWLGSSLSPLRCPKCGAGADPGAGPGALQPLWSAEVVFDDGTAECLVSVEGDDVFAMFRLQVNASSSRGTGTGASLGATAAPDVHQHKRRRVHAQPDDAASVRRCVEDVVRRYGKVAYLSSSKDSKAADCEAGDVWSDIEDDNGGDAANSQGAGDKSASSSSSSSTSAFPSWMSDEHVEAEQRLTRFAVGLSRSPTLGPGRPLELTVRVAFSAEHSTMTTGLAGGGKGGGGGAGSHVRDLRLQSVNRERPWSLSTCVVATVAQSRLRLDAMSARALRRDDVRTETWALVQSLDGALDMDVDAERRANGSRMLHQETLSRSHQREIKVGTASVSAQSIEMCI